VLIERNLEVAAGDGVCLRADVYRLDDARPRPTLLHRTPYGKLDQLAGGSLDARRLVEAGFNLVVQDVRGRFGSEGRFEPYLHEADDGAVTIDWIARRPWSLPSVGMIGRSYAGAAQWLAATTPSPPAALRALSPDVASSDFYEGWTYRGGALELGFCLHWVLGDLAVAPPNAPREAAEWLAELSRLGELDDLFRRPWCVLDALDHLAPFYRSWLRHPARDAYWHARNARERMTRLAAPALSIGGWYDGFLSGTLEAFSLSRSVASTDQARRCSRLVVGPWSHVRRDGRFPSRDFGPGPDLTALHIAWFRRHLLHEPAADAPPVTLFVMGADEWRTFESWPPDASPTTLYLRSGGHAHTAAGDGQLDLARADDEPCDVYRYDPADPVPTLGGATIMRGMADGSDCGPLDQTPVESRRDVLCYSTPPLNRPVTVIGDIEAVLFAASSAPDTDFTAKLVDVEPGGRATILCDGITRARHQIGRLLDPGAVHRIAIRVGATAHRFGRGHRIRLEISSSNFPRYDRNPNTGGPSLALGDGPMVCAHNTIHHAGRWASQLRLRVLADG
jgi:putative CocE/NonD family hydrolase